jgi:hypothetical protein
MRDAYEKLRRTRRTLRRGRIPGVPVELYHDLDEMTRRIDGLTEISGANNAALAAALEQAARQPDVVYINLPFDPTGGSGTGPGGGGGGGTTPTDPPSQWVTHIRKCREKGSAGASSTSGTHTFSVKWKFFEYVDFFVTTASGGPAFVKPEILVAGVNVWVNTSGGSDYMNFVNRVNGFDDKFVKRFHLNWISGGGGERLPATVQVKGVNGGGANPNIIVSANLKVREWEPISS